DRKLAYLPVAPFRPTAGQSVPSCRDTTALTRRIQSMAMDPRNNQKFSPHSGSALRGCSALKVPQQVKSDDIQQSAVSQSRARQCYCDLPCFYILRPASTPRTTPKSIQWPDNRNMTYW